MFASVYFVILNGRKICRSAMQAARCKAVIFLRAAVYILLC